MNEDILILLIALGLAGLILIASAFAAQVRRRGAGPGGVDDVVEGDGSGFGDSGGGGDGGGDGGGGD